MHITEAKLTLEQHLRWASGKGGIGIGRAELNAALDAAGARLGQPVDHIKDLVNTGDYHSPALYALIRFLVSDIPN